MTTTIVDLISAAEQLDPPAPDRDRRTASGIWAAEYEDYARLSDEVRAQFDHTLDLRYGNDPRHIVDVYVPAGTPADAPVFVFFHGGAVEEGHPRRYGFVGRPYLERGAIYVSAGYRLLSKATAERRDAVEAELGGLVHALQGEAEGEVAEVRRLVQQAGVDAAVDARSAIAWVHRNIAAFGGDPNRITIGGHSSGAMVTVAAGCANGWQEALGVPVDVVKAIVPVGGRYGLWLANALIGGFDITNPPRTWALTAFPRAVVVFGEEEYDGDGEEVPERAKDCAIIGRSLIAALSEGGAEVADLGLSPRGHWQTLRSLTDEGDRTLPAVLDAMGVAL